MKKVYEYKTKYKEGFIHDEIKSLCEEEGVDIDVFLDKLGVNTCIMRDGQMITYHCDVDLALRCCLENRDKNVFEWD